MHSIRPGAFLRRGTAKLDPETIRYLAENEDAIETLKAGLEEKREQIIQARREAEALHAKIDEREAALALREKQLAEARADLDERERAMAARYDHVAKIFDDTAFAQDAEAARIAAQYRDRAAACRSQAN